MASFAEYDQFDGLGLARLVRDGAISSAELCEEAIRRAEELNPKLNAIVTKTYEFARESLHRLPTDGPFCGVPFLLKDAHHALRGYPMSSGCQLLRAFVPSYNAEIVNRFIKAGLVIIGKTNTPEFKLGFVAEPQAFGPTRNPWNLDYASGGSSGGSAAAVAAHIVPLASGTDEGGSIRVPASYCGLFGFKPSRGRNPVGPDFDEEADGASCSHVVTRSVRDSAAVLDVVSGYEPGAPYGILANERPFLDEVEREPGRLRIALCMRPLYGKKIHPECVQAVEHACRLLAGLGHEVEESTPDFAEEDAALNWAIVMIGNVAALVDKLVRTYGRSAVERGLELSTRTMYSAGRSLKADDFARAKRRWRHFGLVMAQHLTGYDMILTPTLGEPPVAVGSQNPITSDRLFAQMLCSFLGQIVFTNRRLTSMLLEEFVAKFIKPQMPFTFTANVTGQPAMSVPLYWTKDGLPCGVQFIGRYGDEATLLRLAGQLEKAQPWFDKKPPILP